MLTVGFTLLFTALSALCAAYVVKAVQFYRARIAETKKLRTPETGRQAVSPARSESEGEDLLELELLVRVTSSYNWWLIFQARAPPHGVLPLHPRPLPAAAAAGRLPHGTYGRWRGRCLPRNGHCPASLWGRGALGLDETAAPMPPTPRPPRPLHAFRAPLPLRLHTGNRASLSRRRVLGVGAMELQMTRAWR